MSWLGRLFGRPPQEPGPVARQALDDIRRWLETPTVGHEKRVGKQLDELSKSWHVPLREESARGVLRFFQARLVELEHTAAGLRIEIDTSTGWWETPPGHILSLQARFDRRQEGDNLISGRLYQIGRVGANRYLIVGR
ncbi:MAG: hypothetical protein U0641_07920 [Anaerolineae bacterium]